MLEQDTCIGGSRGRVEGSTHPGPLLLLQVLNLIFTIVLHSEKVIDTMHPYLGKIRS